MHYCLNCMADFELCANDKKTCINCDSEDKPIKIFKKLSGSVVVVKISYGYKIIESTNASNLIKDDVDLTPETADLYMKLYYVNEMLTKERKNIMASNNAIKRFSIEAEDIKHRLGVS